MNSANAAVLFVLFIALSAYVVRYWLGDHQDEMVEIYRYRLFAVRDKLIMLAAEEKIEEQDETFKFLYKTTNDLLPICRPIGLRGVLRAVVLRASSDTDWTANLERALHHDVTEVRSITRELISTLIDIIIVKSPSIRFASKCMWLISCLRRFIPRHVRLNDAYDVYRQLDHMRRAV